MPILQTSRRVALTCLVVVALCGFAAGAESPEPRLLFHAPFEESTDAVVAGGNPKPLRAQVKLEEGRVGKAAHASGGGYQKLSYDGRGNIDLNAGTLSFFYKPTYKIVERAWEPIM
jgi:hypothetical protein